MVSVPSLGSKQILLNIWIFRIMKIWFIIALLYMGWQFIKYLYVKCKLLKNSTPLDDAEAVEAVNKFPELKKVYHRRRVKIFQNSEVSGPFTAGIFTNLIILPRAKFADGYSLDIYGHELYHIKNRDVMLKFLCILAIGMHWYNPCIYLLFYQICHISEYYCDECVIKNLEKKERLEYGKLLVYMGSQIKKSPIFLSNGILRKKKNLEKRILLIVNYKRVKPTVLLNVLLKVIFIIAFLISIVSYNTNTIYGGGVLDFTEDSGGIFIPEGETGGWVIGDPTVNLPFFISENIFSDEYGNKYYGDSICTSIECRHRLIEGTSYQHEKKMEGSCSVSTTEANRCDFCKKVYEIQSVISVSYTPCLHK